MTFLRELYRSLRVHEFATLPWPCEQVRLFLDQQFDMQHRYYVATYPQADFLLIMLHGAPVGRLYLDVSRDLWCVIDIGIKPERRNAGIGSAIMGGVQRGARTMAGTGVLLHVACDNHGAQRLYRRLGFREVAREEPTYARMEWHPKPAVDPAHIAPPSVS